MSKTLKDFKKLVEKKPSGWSEKAAWRISNEDWLNYSAQIALKVLKAIDGSSDFNQKKLAERLNVSPQYVSNILKGQENLTLETISKLERALSISLIEIPQNEIKINIKAGVEKPLKYFKRSSTKRLQ